MTDLIDWDQNVNKSRKSDMGQFGTIFGWNNFRIITYCIAIADMSKKKQNKTSEVGESLLDLGLA